MLSSSARWPRDGAGKLSFLLLVAGLFLASSGTALATRDLVVNTFDDTFDGVCDLANCSLRDAIFEANKEESEESNLVRAVLLPAGTYNLTISNAVPEDRAVSGDLDLTRGYLIQGQGSSPGETIVDATGLGEKAFEARLSSVFVNFTIRGGTARLDPAWASSACLFPAGNWCDFCDPATAVFLGEPFISAQCDPGDGGPTRTFTLFDGCFDALYFEQADDGSDAGFVCFDRLENGGAVGNMDSSNELLFENMILEDNSAEGDGGALMVPNRGRVVLRNSVVRGNHAGDDGGGIAVTDSAAVVLTNSTISSNDADSAGGAIYAAGDSSVLVFSSTANDNTSTDGGVLFATGNASFSISESTLQGNDATRDGGSLFLRNDTAGSLSNSRVEGNTAAREGGAIYMMNDTSLWVVESTLASNEALADELGPSGFIEDGGGAIYATNAAVVLVERSLLAGNRAPQASGGAIAARGATSLSLRNTTLTGNEAGGHGGALSMTQRDFPGVLWVESSTIAGNVAGLSGGGIFNKMPTSIVGAFVENTIVAGNSAAGSPEDCAEDAEAPRVSLSVGFNLDSTDTCGFDQATDLAGVDPLLSALADNGGPTETRALQADSPAIDAGTTNDLAPTVDQRGVSRPQGSQPDIGACERQQSDPPGGGGDDLPLTVARATAWSNGDLSGRVRYSGVVDGIDLTAGLTFTATDGEWLDESGSIASGDCQTKRSGAVRCVNRALGIKGKFVRARFKPTGTPGEYRYVVHMNKLNVPQPQAAPLSLSIDDGSDTYSGSSANCSAQRKKMVCRN